MERRRYNFFTPVCACDFQHVKGKMIAVLAYSVSTVAMLGSIPQVKADNFLENLKIQNEASQVVDVGDQLPSLSGSFLAAQAAGANSDGIEAITNYRRAIELDPENINLQQSLFSALTVNGEISEAIKLLKSIPADSQNNIVNHVVSASNALKQKSWAQALSHIDKVEGRELDQTLALIFGAWALVGERKGEEALKRLDEIDGADWQNMLREYHAGLILSAENRDSEAIPRLQNAIGFRAVASALTGAYLRALEALARSQARTGDVSSALVTTNDGLKMLNAHPPLVALRSEILLKQAKVQPLISSPQQGGAEIFFDAGTAITRQGGLPFAQGHLQLANYLAPESAAIQYALGNVYTDEKKYILANEVFSNIAETSPYYRRARLEYGLNLNRLDQLPDAVKALGKIVENDPLDLISVLSLGAIHAQHEQFEEAVKVYSATIDKLPKLEHRYWSLFYRRGIGYERTKQWPKAEADFKQALELSPDQADVLNYLGYSWIDQGINLDEGLEMIRKAVQLRPNQGFIIDSLGWAYYRLGRYEEAVQELEKAQELMPSDPVVIDHLGDAYWKANRKLEATFQWKHALTSDPTEDDRLKIEKKLQEGLTN